jgi:hypothetical protein
MTESMLSHIADLPWVRENIPVGWDFRGKSPEDLATIQFGLFRSVENRNLCKIVYGGQVKATEAARLLRDLGFHTTLMENKNDVSLWCVFFEVKPSEVE